MSQNTEVLSSGLRYDYTPEEISEVESQVYQMIKDQTECNDTGNPIFAVWTSHDSAVANVVRSTEKKFQDDMPEIMSIHEGSSIFLNLFDSRQGADGVLKGFVQGYRLSTANKNSDEGSDGQVQTETGLILVDDVIASAQDFSARDFYDYYTDRGFDPSRFVSVETNQRIKKTERYMGVRMSQLGYLAIYKFVTKDIIDDESPKPAIIASLNTVAKLSFRDAGIEYDPLAGRVDLKTPVSDGGFADNFSLVSIGPTPKNIEIFSALDVLNPTPIELN